MTDLKDAAHPQLSEIIEECQHWLTGVLSGLFYIKTEQLKSFPKAYAEWFLQAEEAGVIPSQGLAQLKRSAHAVSTALEAARATVPPKQDQFAVFMEAFEDFMGRLTLIEKQAFLSDHGVDPQTGFKTSSSLIAELKKELDRRSRRGNPFSVAIVKIDGEEKSDEPQLTIIAEAFRKCLRSFDDIYRSDDKEFVIGLKHSDTKGGIRFTERLKDELKILNADFTFSSCVAEPDPADDMVTFLDNMRADLAKITKAGQGQVIEFEELSPLQRYVNTITTKS